MDKAAAADADRGRRPAAPAELDAAADDIGGIRPRCDIEQQAGQDEKPDFVNTEHGPLSVRSAFFSVSLPDDDTNQSIGAVARLLHDPVDPDRGFPSATTCL